MKNAKLLDAFPLVRFFKREAGSEQVKALLAAAVASRTSLLISELNAGEVFYAIARKFGAERAEEILAELFALPIERIPATWDIVLAAAKLKAQWAMSYADCFAAATAIQHHAILVTGDPEFKQVEHLMKIEWV